MTGSEPIAKDADSLARLLVAGQLKPVVIPSDWLEAIRYLTPDG